MFEFKELEIKGVILIKPEVFEDDRGFFMEVYKESDFVKAGIKERFIQENHSKSKMNVFRGFHYQKNPTAQAKLVRCVRGSVLDVTADIKKGSSTYGKFVSVVLSENNRRILYIPVGFAHGFLALEDDSEIIYKSSREYAPEYERGIIYNDPDISMNFLSLDIIISKKDANLPTLRQADNNFL